MKKFISILAIVICFCSSANARMVSELKFYEYDNSISFLVAPYGSTNKVDYENKIIPIFNIIYQSLSYYYNNHPDAFKDGKNMDKLTNGIESCDKMFYFYINYFDSYDKGVKYFKDFYEKDAVKNIDYKIAEEYFKKKHKDYFDYYVQHTCVDQRNKSITPNISKKTLDYYMSDLKFCVKLYYIIENLKKMKENLIIYINE